MELMNQEPGWLFRQRDLILGPVPAKQIVDKLYSGELTPSSEVQRMGSGVFRKISEVAEFHVHVAKASAKQRVDAQVAADRITQRRRLVRVVVGLTVALVVVGAGVAAVARYLAVHPLIGKNSEELAWGDITVDAPTVKRAQRALDDELVVYNDTRAQRRPALAQARTEAPRTERPGPAAAAPPAGKGKLGREDPDGMSIGEVDENAINTVVAKFKPTLIPCIRQVAKPGVSLKIPIEFAISDVGKVTRVWVDNPDLKDSGLSECLLRELQKWPFRGGAGASVNLAFNVGKRG